jgi:hypothetical protein
MVPPFFMNHSLILSETGRNIKREEWSYGQLVSESVGERGGLESAVIGHWWLHDCMIAWGNSLWLEIVLFGSGLTLLLLKFPFFFYFKFAFFRVLLYIKECRGRYEDLLR